MATQEERMVKLLSLVDVLEPLSEEELRDLAQRCPDLRLSDGQDFYDPESHDGGLFLILEGRVRVCTSTPAVKRTTLELLGSGTVFGPAGSRPCRPTPRTPRPSGRPWSPLWTETPSTTSSWRSPRWG